MATQAYNPKLIERCVCLAMYRMAKGVVYKATAITDDEITVLVQNLGVNCNQGQVKAAITALLRSSTIERQREHVWRLTEKCRTAAEHAATELGTRVLPERPAKEVIVPDQSMASTGRVLVDDVREALLELLALSSAKPVRSEASARAGEILAAIGCAATSSASPLEAAAVQQVLVLAGTDAGELGRLAAELG